jgi:hypothetical protein
VLDLSELPSVPSIFAASREQRGALQFLWEFVKSITAPVVHDGREHIDYVPTQILTEYFRERVKGSDGSALNGIVYPSARPPLDLHLPLGSQMADAMCLEAVYGTVLSSLQKPGANPTADRIKTAIGWLVKAWRNTATVHFPERVVFLKTAYEALTGTSKSHLSARMLRQLFESVPDTSPTDAELLVWSPVEQAVYEWTFTKNGKPQTVHVTPLEHWFMSLADARNTIIHQGVVPSLAYTNTSNAAYEGPFVFTAEFLLRAVIKVSLAQCGYSNLWRSAAWRAVKAAYDESEACERASESSGAVDPSGI